MNNPRVKQTHPMSDRKVKQTHPIGNPTVKRTHPMSACAKRPRRDAMSSIEER